MMPGVDQYQVLPLLLREGAEEGMLVWLRRQLLKRCDFGAELVDGCRLVVAGAGEPPLGDFDARFHTPLTHDSLQDQRPEEFADDPRALMLVAVQGRAQAFAHVVQRL